MPSARSRNLRAVADYARDVAAMRDSGQDWRAQLDQAAGRFPDQVRGWIGEQPADDRFAAVMDSFVRRADKAEVDVLSDAIILGRPVGRCLHRCLAKLRAVDHAGRQTGLLARRPRLVTSDVTFTPDIEITAESELYRALAATDTGLARLLHAHLGRWFADFHPCTMQHDGLTLAATLQLPSSTSPGTACHWTPSPGCATTRTALRYACPSPPTTRRS